VLHPARYVGLANYRDLFGSESYYVKKVLFNAAYLAGIGIPLGMITGLAIAMFLNAKVLGMTWYRTLYYVPAVVPTVASAVLWLWVLNPYDYGLVNAGWKATLTAWFGIPAPTWLSSEQWSKPALIFMGLWGAGGGMIIWLAGLQGIPKHLYEAAEIDGASPWHKFLHVTIPMLSPTIFFNLIMGTIGALQTFETVYVMTDGLGGPVDSTMVPVLYLFNNAFRFFKMGYASAVAWLLFWIILVLTLVQLKLAPRWVHYEGR
jgi:ABC-type sugar transport system permease subunit